MRRTLLLFCLLPAFLATPAFATKPTAPLEGRVTVSSAAPQLGETIQVRFTFSASTVLTGLRLRVWSKSLDSDQPCAAPESRGPSVTTVPLVVPGKSYTLETSVKFQGAHVACDIFLEPLSKFGDQEASLGMIFRQTISRP